MERTLEGRVVLVTGASRGIGAAIANAAAERGAAVALTARSEVRSRLGGSVDQVAIAIRRNGGTALAIRGDIGDEDHRVNLVRTVERELGPVDVLVNNAAAFGTTALADMSLKRFRICMEVNVVAPFRLMQLVVPGMVERRQGWVINISSDASRRPAEGPHPDSGPGASGYGSSKAALELLTRSVAWEVGAAGVAVNALMPSKPVPTPAMLELDPELTDIVTEKSFAHAACLVATVDPGTVNGCILYSEDVLHPELGRRGWLAAT